MSIAELYWRFTWRLWWRFKFSDRFY